jgi:outer membrane protein assembly factor BamD (BamD/ComL family)
VTHLRRILLCSLLLAAGAGRAPADEDARRRETLELDPEKGAWQQVTAPVADTAEGDLQIARTLQTQHKYRRAASALKRWIKTYGSEHELYPRAALLQAENLIARREYYKAHLKLVDFLSTYSGTEFEEDALTQEFIIAEVFIGGTRRKFLGMRILKADDIGLAILDDIAVNHPGTRLAELAIVTKANHYFRTGDFTMAEFEYNQLVENYDRSRYTRPALLQGARSALASFGGVRFDDAALIEADERFRRYLTLYPGSAEQEGIGLILHDITETRAAKELTTGRYYARAGHPAAAEFYYRSTRQYWPETVAALQAAEELDKLGLKADEPSKGPDVRSEQPPDSTAVDTLRPDRPPDRPGDRE